MAMDSIGSLWMVTYLSMLSMLIPFSSIMATVIKTGKVYVLQVHENRYTLYLSHTFHRRPSKGLLLENNLWPHIVCSLRTWYLFYDGTNHNHTTEKLIIHLLPSWGKSLEKRDHFLSLYPYCLIHDSWSINVKLMNKWMNDTHGSILF